MGRSKSNDSASNQNKELVADGDEEVLVDLLNLVPENFNEIPYIHQINVKRKAMEKFN